MLNRKNVILMIILLNIILITACSAGIQSDNIVANSIEILDNELKDKDYLQLEFDMSAIDVVMAIIGDKIIYYNYGETSSSYIYYSFDWKTNITYELGRIDHPHIHTGSTAQIGDKLYFYMNTISPEDSLNTKLETALYEIDTVTNTLNKILHEELDQTLVYIDVIGEDLVSFKGKIQEMQGITYLDRINSNNLEKNMLVTELYDIENSAGESIYNFTQANGCIYTIVVAANDTEREYAIKKYNSEGSLIQTIKLEDTVVKAINGQRVSKFTVVGEYAYIRNFSGTGVLSHISGDTAFAKVISYDDLDIALGANNSEVADHALLFSRDLNRVWRLDAKNDMLDELNTNCEEIGFLMLSDTENALIVSSSQQATYMDYMEIPTITSITLSDENTIIY